MKKTLAKWLIVLAAAISTPAFGATVCDAIELSADILTSTYSQSNQTTRTQALRKVSKNWTAEIQSEIDRQEVGLKLFKGGSVPPAIENWKVDDARYLCTPEGIEFSEPRPCSFATDLGTSEQLRGFIQVIESNLSSLSLIRSEIEKCTFGGLVKNNRPQNSLNLVADPTQRSSEPLAGESGEPVELQGKIFWSHASVEQNREVSQSMRDSLQFIWAEQVAGAFKDFTALNLENGKGLSADAKLVQEGDVTVLYRDGSPVMSFYKPQGVYLRAFVEIPYSFRNKLGGASAVSIMLRRTTRGNYSVQEFAPAVSLSEASDAAFVERSLFQLSAMDARAEDLIKSISTVTTGLEEGLKRRFEPTKLRYKIAASILWIPSRIIGGGLGFMIGTSLAPLFQRAGIGEIAATAPSIFLLSGMMMFSHLIDKMSLVHEHLLGVLDHDRAKKKTTLAELRTQKSDLLEFRTEIGLIKRDLYDQGSCRNLIKQRISKLLSQGKLINGI
jgi:hypothetical protein